MDWYCVEFIFLIVRKHLDDIPMKLLKYVAANLMFPADGNAFTQCLLKEYSVLSSQIAGMF